MKIHIKSGDQEKTLKIPTLTEVETFLKNCPVRLEKGIEEIKSDVQSVRERDPAATGTVEVLTLYSGVHAMAAHRLAHSLQGHNHGFTARFVSQAAKTITGIEIHPSATIGKDLFIDHGTGVVIGETAVIGDGCTIYQGVTLGGTGKETGKRHPTLGNNVTVGAGAKILGPVHIGDNSKIAAGAVVLKDIPANSTAVGIPARVVKKNRIRCVEQDLDQIHIPDPVEREFAKLRKEIAELKEEIKGEKE